MQYYRAVNFRSKAGLPEPHFNWTTHLVYVARGCGNDLQGQSHGSICERCTLCLRTRIPASYSLRGILSLTCHELQHVHLLASRSSHLKFPWELCDGAMFLFITATSPSSTDAHSRVALPLLVRESLYCAFV
jgi:hypothetical protein